MPRRPELVTLLLGVESDCARRTRSPHAGEFGHAPAEGAGWSYEVKWDGYRTLALKDGARVKLLSSNLKDATKLYPPSREKWRGSALSLCSLMARLSR